MQPVLRLLFFVFLQALAAHRTLLTAPLPVEWCFTVCFFWCRQFFSGVSGKHKDIDMHQCCWYFTVFARFCFSLWARLGNANQLVGHVLLLAFFGCLDQLIIPGKIFSPTQSCNFSLLTFLDLLLNTHHYTLHYTRQHKPMALFSRWTWTIHLYSV